MLPTHFALPAISCGNCCPMCFSIHFVFQDNFVNIHTIPWSMHHCIKSKYICCSVTWSAVFFSSNLPFFTFVSPMYTHQLFCCDLIRFPQSYYRGSSITPISLLWIFFFILAILNLYQFIIACSINVSCCDDFSSYLVHV